MSCNLAKIYRHKVLWFGMKDTKKKKKNDQSYAMIKPQMFFFLLKFFMQGKTMFKRNHMIASIDIFH